MDTKRYLAAVTSNESVGEQVRRDIAETLAAMQTIATGLAFPALTEGYQWKLHQLALNDADFYVFVVGSDYGPLSETGVGYLHRALASARASNKPTLVLQCNALSQPRDEVDQRRLADLVAEMERQVAVIKLARPQDIRENLERFVDDLVESEALRGWCPMPQWGAGAVEHQDLLQQVDVLRRRLDSERLTAEKSLAPQRTAPVLAYRVKVFRDGNVSPYEYTLALDWSAIFKTVAPLLTEPQRESNWKSLFEERLLRLALPELQSRHPKAHGFVELKLDAVVFDQIKHYFRQRGWLVHSQGIWQLSALGEDRWLRSS